MGRRQSTMESMVDKSFWQGKKVLVTGHTGFKGSWLAIWLKMMGAEVIGYSLAPETKPSMSKVSGLSKDIISIEGDVRDLDYLNKIVDTHKPDIIFHLAAQAIVQRSYLEPLTTYTTNVIGTANILEAAGIADSVKAMVCVTSDKCYENNETQQAYTENDTLGGRSKNIQSTNPVCGGDWADYRLIPDIIRAIYEAKEIKIRNPKAVRPWQHVLTPLSGYLLLAQNLYNKGSEFASAWNFGPEDEAVDVSTITNKFLDRSKQKLKWNIDDKQYAHESNYLRLDSSKAKQKLNWQQLVDLDNAMDMTIDWYQAFYEKKQNIRDISEQQIKQFYK